MSDATLEYISDEAGNLKSVIVPIKVWNEIASELETRYLLQSETMKRRLLEARGREGGLSLEETLEKLI